MALPTDQTERLAAGRRQRRIDAVPDVYASYGYDLVLNDFFRRVSMVASAANTQVGSARDLAAFLIGRLGARLGEVKISVVELSISWLVVRLSA